MASLMKSRAFRALAALASVYFIVSGTRQVAHGLQEQSTPDPAAEVSRLNTESNAAVAAGNKLVLAAGPRFQKLFEDVNSLGLAGVRAAQTPAVQELAAMFVESGQKFREAGRLLNEARLLPVKTEFREYFGLKAQGYIKNAEAKEQAAALARLVLDAAITDVDTLITRMAPINERIVAADKESKALAAKAASLQPAL